MKNIIYKKTTGFTLIEVIVTMVLFSITSVMFVTLFTNTIAKSGQTISLLRNQYGSATSADGVVGVMEQITYDFDENKDSDYKTKINAGTYDNTTVTTTGSHVTINGHEYRKVVVSKGDQKTIAIFPALP